MSDSGDTQDELLPTLFGGARKFPRDLSAFTPARLAIDGAGNRPGVRAWIDFREDHAAARDAVHSEVPKGWPAEHGLCDLASSAPDRHTYLSQPKLGERLDDASVDRWKEALESDVDLQLVVGDGLSSAAAEAQVPDLIKAIRREADSRGWTVGVPAFVRLARVAVMDHVADLARPKVCAILIGERPGLLSAVSLSIYAAFHPSLATTHADRNCLSNIHAKGTPPKKAADMFAKLAQAMFDQRTSGVRLLLD